MKILPEISARFPELSAALNDAVTTLSAAEDHYAHMRTIRAEEEYVAASRSADPYALDLAARIREARAQYRADLSEAHEVYKAALQAKTNAHIALLNALEAEDEAA